MTKLVQPPGPAYLDAPSSADTVDYAAQMLRELAAMISRSISAQIAAQILDIAKKVECHGSK